MGDSGSGPSDELTTTLHRLATGCRSLILLTHGSKSANCCNHDEDLHANPPTKAYGPREQSGRSTRMPLESHTAEGANIPAPGHHRATLGRYAIDMSRAWFRCDHIFLEGRWPTCRFSALPSSPVAIQRPSQRGGIPIAIHVHTLPMN
jgi:hypothetical protein